jgi:hypothetical protein
MYWAFNDPKEMKQLDPARTAVDQIVESGNLPAMLRIPKDRKERTELNGG